MKKSFLFGVVLLATCSASTLTVVNSTQTKTHKTPNNSIKPLVNKKSQLQKTVGAVKDQYYFYGSDAHDREYVLIFSIPSIKTILDLMKSSEWGWYTWVGMGSWYHGWYYSSNFQGDSIAYDDDGSISDLVHGKQSHIYTGKGYNKFNLSSFKSTLQKTLAIPSQKYGIALEFYCDYKFLAHNEYGAKWFTTSG